jgi:phosphoribosylglycinamide formyltransferase-1
VHYVTAELDGGPVIAQVRLAIEPGDNEQRLAQRLLPLEHRLLVAVVADIASGRLALADNAVRFDGRPLAQPLQWRGDTLVDQA